MQKLNVNVSAPQRVSIGRQGENGVRAIEFDCTTFAKYAPNGIPVVLLQRPGDDAPYPVPLDIDGALARWTVRAVDTEHAGTACVEVQWLDGGKIAKSATFFATVSKALGVPTAPPEPPVKGWVEKVLDAASVILSHIGDAMDAAASALASAATAAESAETAKSAEASATASAKSAQKSAESAKTSSAHAADSAEKSREWAEEAHGAAAKKFVLLDEDEYDDDGVPTIAGENGIIYLVPSPTDSEDEHNACSEWLYIGVRWERLGGVKLPDLDGVVKDVTIGGASVVQDGVAEIPPAYDDTELRGDVSGLKEDLTQKATNPNNPVVGQWGRVKEIGADGYPVWETADLPIADGNGKSGIIRIADVLGIRWSNAAGGGIAINFADEKYISDRGSGNRPLIPYHLDYAVKAAMCDGKGPAWTPEEQLAGRQRLGFPGDFELIETITLDEDTESVSRSARPDGTPYEYKSLLILIKCPAASNKAQIRLYRNSIAWTNFIGALGFDGINTTIAYTYGFLEVKNGMLSLLSSTSGGYDSSTVYGNSASNLFNLNQKAKEITNIILATSVAGTKLPAGTTIRIYAI